MKHHIETLHPSFGCHGKLGFRQTINPVHCGYKYKQWRPSPMKYRISIVTYARIQKVFFQKGTNFILVDGWIQIPLKSGYQWPASETPFAFRYRTDDGPTLNAGFVATLWFFRGSRTVPNGTLYLCYFSEGGGESGPPVPPLDPRMDTVGKRERKWYLLVRRKKRTDLAAYRNKRHMFPKCFIRNYVLKKSA